VVHAISRIQRTIAGASAAVGGFTESLRVVVRGLHKRKELVALQIPGQYLRVALNVGCSDGPAFHTATQTIARLMSANEDPMATLRTRAISLYSTDCTMLGVDKRVMQNSQLLVQETDKDGVDFRKNKSPPVMIQCCALSALFNCQLVSDPSKRWITGSKANAGYNIKEAALKLTYEVPFYVLGKCTVLRDVGAVKPFAKANLMYTAGRNYFLASSACNVQMLVTSLLRPIALSLHRALFAAIHWDLVSSITEFYKVIVLDPRGLRLPEQPDEAVDAILEQFESMRKTSQVADDAHPLLIWLAYSDCELTGVPDLTLRSAAAEARGRINSTTTRQSEEYGTSSDFELSAGGNDLELSASAREGIHFDCALPCYTHSFNITQAQTVLFA